MATLIGDSLRSIFRSEKEETKRLADFIASMHTLRRGSDSSRVSRMMPSLPDLSSLHSEELAPDLCGISFDKRDETYFALSHYDDAEDIGTVSFDLRLGGLVARSDTVFSEVREEDLRGMKHWELEPGQPFEFRYDPDGRNVYYFVSSEELSHSSDLLVDIHAKSTSGRLGCHAQGVGRTKKGGLITLLRPLAFNLIARSGETSFSQGVVRYKGSRYATPDEIMERGLVSFEGVELKESLDPLGVVIRFDASRVYVAKRTNDPIDMSAVGLDWRRWWEKKEGGFEMALEEKRLHLLGSQGAIGLNAACGIISKETKIFNGGGIFGCLAGVVQPGWFGKVTMEPYSNVRTMVRTGDVAGHVLIDPVVGKVPEVDKGNYAGVYQGQRAPRLPKMFSEEEW